MKPVLDPQRDLVGATPETLARALFRRIKPLGTRPGGKPVVRDQVAIEKAAPNKPDNRVPHLRKGV